MRPSSRRSPDETAVRPAGIAGGRRVLRTLTIVVMLALVGSAGAGAFAQQKQKNSKKSDKDAEAPDTHLPLPDPQAIDYMVAQMLGAWQVGDVDAMHKFYADDLVVVSGAWEPPLLGWDNYARAYKTQRARVQAGRLDRTNTYSRIMGDSAWVTYQWKFSGNVDGKPATAEGHTTLVLQKRAGNWIIVVNHSSEVPSAGPEMPAAAPATPASSAAPSEPHA